MADNENGVGVDISTINMYALHFDDFYVKRKGNDTHKRYLIPNLIMT